MKILAKSLLISTTSVYIMLGVGVSPVFAITLMTEREALHQTFRSSDEIVPEEKVLSDAQHDEILRALGGKWVNHTTGGDADILSAQRKFTFHFAVKDGQKTAAAVILEEPGKWGPIQFMVQLNLDGSIADMRVLRYTENRGRPIARRTFLKQFIGKTLAAPFQLDEDIVAVSGATISSGAAAFTAKKALLLYKMFYLP